MKSFFYLLVPIIFLEGFGAKPEAIIADFKLDEIQYTVTEACI